MASLLRTPLSTGRVYIDRCDRRWYIERIINEGLGYAAKLPALALARCLDSVGVSLVVRLPQWFDVNTGRWHMSEKPVDHPLDLVRAA